VFDGYDEDGSVTDIGTVTSSGYYGTFEKAWTPSAEGTYKIIATSRVTGRTEAPRQQPLSRRSSTSTPENTSNR